MGESATAGLSNSAYANWLTKTVCDDCSCIRQITISYNNGDQETLSESSQICNWINGATSEMVSTIQLVVYLGPDDNNWSAVDDRMSVNLQRTENNGMVPVRIYRPTDH